MKLDDFDRQRRQLDEKITRKDNELEVVRHELNQVKEFRRKKGQMQKELEEVNFFYFMIDDIYYIMVFFNFSIKIKEAMLWNSREQKETLEKLEQRFSDEKLRLQQEANKRIEEIAEHAQDEALKLN